MQEWIRNISVFLLMSSVLSGLVKQEMYRGYIQFFTSIFLVLTIIQPAVAMFGDDNDLYRVWQQQISKWQIEDMDTTLSMAEGNVKEVILKTKKTTVEEDVREMGQDKQLEIETVEATLDEQGYVTVFVISLLESSNNTKSKIHAFRKDLQEKYSLREEQIQIWV